jgi:hypothetical protein
MPQVQHSLILEKMVSTTAQNRSLALHAREVTRWRW